MQVKFNSKFRNIFFGTNGTFTQILSSNKIGCMKKLSELAAGEVGIIHSFEKDELYIKLLEMGCVPGEPVKILQVAPLGDPISIEVSGYHLSLRLSEADNIMVTIVTEN
jgi:ferrous iron transport protein A